MKRPPNILLFFTDQQRADTVHALGNDIIQTPHLDRLCREGVAFERAYSPSPVCVSARCALIHGLYAHRTGCFENGYPMPQDRLTLMEALRQAGYRTHGVGKMHFSPDPWALRGFQTRRHQEELTWTVGEDHYLQYLQAKGYDTVFDPMGQRSEMYYVPQISQLPARDHPTAWAADRGIEFLESHDGAQPFFLMTSFIHPHPPFSPPTPWNKLYRTAHMPHAKQSPNNAALMTFINRHQNRYKYRDQGIDRNLVRTLRAFYWACVSFIDYHVGRVLECLESRGWLDNTLILFTSDHGEFLGDYDCFGKRSMLDSAARIPLIARLPGRFEGGQVCRRPVSLIDVMPTALAAAGLPPGDLDGEDLLRVLEGRSRREYVLSQHERGAQAIYMIATDTAKYFYSAPDQREYLLDHASDPDERVNFADDSAHCRTLEDLRARIISHLERDGLDDALDGKAWKTYPRREMPADPGAGLLFQDSPAAADREGEMPPPYHVSLAKRR
jgi:choline-sulfatase